MTVPRLWTMSWRQLDTWALLPGFLKFSAGCPKVFHSFVHSLCVGMVTRGFAGQADGTDAVGGRHLSA
jgi:hypothetical protein